MILQVPPSFMQQKLAADKNGIPFVRLKRQTVVNMPNVENGWNYFVYFPPMENSTSTVYALPLQCNEAY